MNFGTEKDREIAINKARAFLKKQGLKNLRFNTCWHSFWLKRFKVSFVYRDGKRKNYDVFLDEELNIFTIDRHYT